MYTLCSNSNSPESSLKPYSLPSSNDNYRLRWLYYYNRVASSVLISSWAKLVTLSSCYNLSRLFYKVSITS